MLDSSFNPPTRAHLGMATSALRDVVQEVVRGGIKPSGTNVRLLLLLAVNNADKAPKPAPFDQRMALMWTFARDIQNRIFEREEMGQKKEQERTQDDEGLNIDVALTTQPYFHEKSSAIAQSVFYGRPPRSDKDEEVMEQVFLVGYDTLIRIFNPKYYGPPTSTAEVAVASGSNSSTPMQKALDPFFSRARLRVTLREDDEWGGKEDQLAYLGGVVTGEGLSKIGGRKEWGRRIEVVDGCKLGDEAVSSTYARDAAKNRDWDRLGRMVTPEVRAWIEGEKLYAEQ